MIFLDMGNRNSILLIGLMVFLVLCSYSCEEGERVERGQVYVPSLDNVIASEIIHILESLINVKSGSRYSRR